MNQFDLNDLLKFADSNNLQNKSFQEVYNLWKKDIQDAIDSQFADDYLASEEAHLAMAI